MRQAMDRFIDGIEWVAAFFVGIVALDIFVSVLLRYFFAVSIPDSYDFGKMLLGILIFWGIAATRSEEHTSELPAALPLCRTGYLCLGAAAVFLRGLYPRQL